MKKIILAVILNLCSLLLVAQTPLDILKTHISKSDHLFTGTEDFEYMTKSRNMIQECDNTYLLSLGIDTTYLKEFDIISYIAIFHSNKYDFIKELDLSQYIEIDRYSNNYKNVVVYQQIKFDKFEEIISLSTNKNPIMYTLIYIKGIRNPMYNDY